MATPVSCSSQLQPQLLSWFASAAAVAAAILLWGVGAEAAYFGHGLSAGFMLADAVIVTVLEAATIGCLTVQTSGCSCRRCCQCCGSLERMTAAADSCRRAAFYALLTVPCFVQLDRYWLSAVPGGALIFAALLYAAKPCCGGSGVPPEFGKMPTFVRFEEDCCPTTEVPPSTPESSICQPAWQIYVELPGAASRRPQQQPLPQASDDVITGNSPPPPPPPPRRQQKWRCHPPTRPDRQHLISEVDSLSL